ncbi:hypothetical protein K2173_021912 [Erythroxylum novogranatense]|uniref:ZF-HD dimerization-type domain-containing protein n=1 Tax=Erythroxylum novogranatense TaxID=1862640 RepID=A0AAV8T409_9ROSI|nr:hypothetical protein K2173_021912 [Erythroxylum novogranatense]
MDLTTHKAPTKSPPHESDTDAETPLRTHLSKALSLTSASLKNHHLPAPPPTQPLSSLPTDHHQMVVSYKECLKNHAATLGGLALDGCGEFMPAFEPTSLKCAACGCHRNFHRRESYSGHLPPQMFPWTSSPSPLSSGRSPSPSSPASPTPQNTFFPSTPHMLLALSTPLDENHHHHTSFKPTATNPQVRKRARTKFTKEQKEKMQTFAEKMGWKMLRGNDERMVEDFCNEVGVKRNVFKVWMHNNKHRRQNGQSYDFHSSEFNINGANGGVGFETKVTNGDKDNDNNVNSSSYDDSFDRFQIRTKVDDVHDPNDGSSPSSSEHED